MRKLMIMAALSCSLSLGGCLGATEGAVSSPSQATAQAVVLEGTRALYMAELAYNSAAASANAVGQACLAAPRLPCPITPSMATQLRTLNRRATEALEAGHRAQGSAAKAAQANIIFGVVDQIRGLIRR